MQLGSLSLVSGVLRAAGNSSQLVPEDDDNDALLLRAQPWHRNSQFDKTRWRPKNPGERPLGRLECCTSGDGLHERGDPGLQSPQAAVAESCPPGRGIRPISGVSPRSISTSSTSPQLLRITAVGGLACRYHARRPTTQVDEVEHPGSDLGPRDRLSVPPAALPSFRSSSRAAVVRWWTCLQQSRGWRQQR